MLSVALLAACGGSSGGSGGGSAAGGGSSEGVGGGSIVRLLENTARRHRSTFRRAYLHVIRTARKSVRIENAYFLPDRGVRRALLRAASRGVDVQVIVPGRSDIKIIEYASLYALRRIAKRGVKLWRWRGVMLHAKTAVIDGIWSTIGSYNFDSQSRFNNLELAVEILDRDIGDKLLAVFDANIPNCEPFDETTWKGLSWWRKAFAWLGYRLRRYL